MSQPLFLGCSDLIHLVKELGLETVFQGIRDQILEDYLRWDHFHKSSRTADHHPDGVIELMPISDQDTFSFKYVNGHPKNTRESLPTIMAFSVLSDMKTGIPLLVSESTFLTAFRTACTSVLVAQYLAKPDSKVMTVIGNGAQSEFQVLAFYYLMGIRRFRFYDIDPDATYKLVKNLRKYHDLEYVLCDSVREAVKGSDIITTVTADKTNAIILDETLIQQGQHLNAVGGDCPGKTELSLGVLQKCRIWVEYEPQSRVEGEIQQMPDADVIELWRLFQGEGRQTPEEITLFDSVGFALEDYSAIKWIYSRLKEQGYSKTIDLIPYSQNPKDLFGNL